MAGREKHELQVARLATRTVYKLVFIGSYIGIMLLQGIDILLDMAGIGDFLNFNLTFSGIRVFSGIIGLILLPISGAIMAGLYALLFGSLVALGLYIWHFFEDMKITYFASRFEEETSVIAESDGEMPE